MNDTDANFELRRMFFGFAGAILLLVLLYVSRALKIYIFGKRVRATVVKVVTKQPDPAQPGNCPRFSYVLEYLDRAGGSRRVHERQDLRIREFEVGDVVTAFIRGDRHAEILSWRRLIFSGAVIMFICGAIAAGYYALLVRRSG